VWLTAAGVWIAWLLPVLGLVPFVFQRISTVADRYAYLALLGPALALSWWLTRCADSSSRRGSRLALVLTAVLLIACGLWSYRQAGFWRSD